MLYGIKIAWRYLTSSKTQTGLLVAGVATGVFVFIFMSALIGGLAVYLVEQTVGDISHVTLEAPSREAGLLLPESAEALLVQQKASGQRETLRTADAFLPGIEVMEGVKAVSPQIVGNGFVIRGQSRAPVAVTGVETDKVSAIADLQGRLVAGDTVLTNSTVIIGKVLADDLGIGVGQVIRLQSDRNVERALVIAGIFQIGVEALYARAAFVSTATARTLFDLPQGLSRVEIKLDDALLLRTRYESPNVTASGWSRISATTQTDFPNLDRLTVLLTATLNERSGEGRQDRKPHKFSLWFSERSRDFATFPGK